MKAIHLISTLLLAAAAAVQAQGVAMETRSAPPAPARVLVAAEISKLDMEQGQIVLKHGSTTTGFAVSRGLIKGLKSGDRVRFYAETVAGKATVTQLQKTR